MHAKDYGIDVRKGILNEGDAGRIRRAMKKAKAGEDVAVGFIGGSITQGLSSSSPEKCYAYIVYKWWRDAFPDARVSYVNAGIAGTTSQFGAARAESDLLRYGADFCVIDFSADDDDNAHFLETYEGLVRQMYKYKSAPALLILNSVLCNGAGAQANHLKVARAYGLPCVSMKPTIYAKVLDGSIARGDITEDGLYPNDLGHQLIADVITGYLDGVYATLDAEDYEAGADLDLRNLLPVTRNQYEDSRRFRNGNCSRIISQNEGFVPDAAPQEGIQDMFKCGWTAERQGARICFELYGTCLAVLYRKNADRPAPIARAVIDGDERGAVTLDANPDQGQGCSLCLKTLSEHIQYGRHTVEIEIAEAHEGCSEPFYLVALIASGGRNGFL